MPIDRIKKIIKNPLIGNISTVVGISLFIKGVGFLKETMIASKFGLSELIDTFLIAMIIPAFIQNVFLKSFANVFVPNYVAEQNENGESGSLQASSFIIAVLSSLFFLLLAFVITDVFLDFFFPNKSPEYYTLVKTQFWIVAPCILIWGVNSLLNGLLNIHNEFRYSTFSGIFIPVTIILSLLFFKDFFGEYVLASSTLIGCFMSLLYLLGLSLKRDIIKLATPDFKNANFKMMVNQVPLKISSSLFTGIIPIVDKFFAAKLVVGSIAAISYGQKIPAFILGFVIVGIGRVLLPHFSKLATTDLNRAYQQLFKILKNLFFMSLALVALFMVFSKPLVALLFERNEFTSADTEVVAYIQMILLAYVPFYTCGNVLVKFLTSINKNKFMAYMSFINLMANIVLDYFLYQKFGVYGIVLATTLIYSINPIIYLLFTLREYRRTVRS